jgi:hypothetical protein
MHAAQMADELSEREQALRRLPLPYSLALRLRDGGVAAEVICQYVNVERAAQAGLYRIAEAKLPCGATGNRRPLPRVALTHADRTTFGSRGQRYRHRPSL